MTQATPEFYLGTQIDGVHLNAEQLNVRSTDLNDLIGSATYTEALFHILQGRMPSEQERQLFDLVLVSFHGGFGLLPPTTLVPRMVAGTGVNTAQAMAAGFLASGPYHVGAIEQGMKLYVSIADELLASSRKCETAGDVEQFAFESAVQKIESGEIIGGYGHPLLRKDPRPTHMRRILCDMGVEGLYLDIYDGVMRCMHETKSVPPNIDGMTGAILLHLGFQVEHGTGLFLHARSAAMLAHIIEEQTEMPYQTMRRFMFMPVALPKLFNTDFKKLTRRFNKLRDSKLFQSLKNTVNSSTRKAKQAAAEREVADRARIDQHRSERNSKPADASLLRQQIDSAAGVARQDDFASSEPLRPHDASDTGNSSTLVPDQLLDECSSPEMLAGAAFFLSGCLDSLSKDASDSAQARKAQALVQSAMSLIEEAAGVATESAELRNDE